MSDTPPQKPMRPPQTAALPPAGSPLTPLQLGMIYESTLARRPWVNLEQIVVRLNDEEIDAEALRRAWEKVAARHEALRLSILWRRRDVPVQVLHPRIPVEVACEDWSRMVPRKQQMALEQALASDRERGVDLEASPPWRVHLYHLGPRQSVMVWTIHHAFIDGRSMAIVLEDLFAALAGRPMPSDLAKAPGFPAFCKALLARDSQGDEAHFREALARFDEPNALTTTPREGTGTGLRKLMVDARLTQSLSEALRERAEAAGATLADLMHAAWGLVVARWSGRDEAVIGITRSGRAFLPGSARTVGCLINTLPLRMTLGAGQSADQTLTQLRAATLALRPHEQAALSDIRHWSGLPGTVPLFETMVMFERQSLEQSLRQTGPDWQNRRVELREEGALPLTLAIHADPEIALGLEYDPGLIPAERARAMMAHLLEVLASYAKAAPSVPLAQLTMLPRSEEAALLSLGRPEQRLPEGLVPCLATALETAAAARPAAPALRMIGQEGQLSHAELQARANGLAGVLVAEGTRAGEIVAICLNRSPEFVVAVLAVLKAGAAFLPIDPTYPPEVIGHMLTDSGARLMIAGEGTPHPAQMRLIPPLAPAAPVPPPRPAPDPDRLAYVIYTSGSTGTPKGVRVPMRAITAHAAAIGPAYGLTADDRVLQFASLSFDVSIEEILPTLIAGAELVLRDSAMAGSVAGFLDAVEAQGITVLNLPTAFWHLLVDDMARQRRALPPSVRLVIAGGEQINPRALATWHRMTPGVRWLNGYGPTETTITCTLHEPGPEAPGDDIPIGRPTAHACAYILAPDGSLAPTGAVGELWIGGPAVSDGYIGREAETRAAFRPDRFAGSGRIYRTGDRARWRPDGTLAFLGRRDRQVKLRGFRIDLRHIERVLERDPSVGQALALVREQGTPMARLVAWVTTAEGQPAPDPEVLRAAAAQSLPGHMVPALSVVADFPRTPGGKIDTAALIPPQPGARAISGAPTAGGPPPDATTSRIADLMAQALGLPAIGPDDNFHDLGGHSLVAVRLIGQIETELGHRLGVGDLHRAPTPRALAATIQAARIGPRFILPIQPKGSRPPLFAVHVLGRNEEHFRPLAAELGPDQPLFGLTVGPPTQDTPVGVEATARCYFEDIQRYHPQGPISLAAISLASYFAFELAQLLVAAGREVTMLTLFDAEGPGGRSRLRGRARLSMHVAQFRRRGMLYLLQVAANRLTAWRNRLELTKARPAALPGRRPRAEGEESSGDMIGAFIKANVQAVEAYDAQPLDVPLTIFRAEENRFDSPEAAEDGLGWGPVAAAGFTVIDNPGGHLSMLQPPHVRPIAREMARLAGWTLPDAESAP